MESLENILKLSEQQLDAHVQTALAEISHRPLTTEEEACTDERLVHVRLIAEWILRHPDSQQNLLMFVALVGELKVLAPEYEDALMVRMFDALKHGNLGELGFRSQDIPAMDASYLAFQITHQATPDATCCMQSLSDMGKAVLSAQGLWLLTGDEKLSEKQLAGKSVSLCLNDWIHVVTGHGDAHLRQNQSDDIHAIDRFVFDYVAEMKDQAKKVKPKQRFLTPETGTILIAKIIANDGLNIRIRIQETGYEPIEAPLQIHVPAVLHYQPELFYKVLTPGEYIRVQVVDPAEKLYSIEKPFVKYIVDTAKGDLDYSCLCIYIGDSPNGMVWMSDIGIAIYTSRTEGFVLGNFAEVEVDRVDVNGIVHGINPGLVNESFDMAEAMEDCVWNFKLPDEEIPQHQNEAEGEPLDPHLLQLLVRHLFTLQRRQTSIAERCRTLAVARIMAAMVGDTEAMGYMSFVAKYLSGISAFLAGDMTTLKGMTLQKPQGCTNSELLLQRQGTIQLLQKWGETDQSSDAFLHDAADDFREMMPDLSKMARLIRTSNELKSLVSGSSVNVLKQEIFRLLHLEDEQNLLESNDNIYLGIESTTSEFKESIVFPPGNQMQPDCKTQQFNVMKGVCAFLNSKTGGTLYLGVTDEGAVRGIQYDMDYLKVKNVDTFMRVCVQDVIAQLMGKDVLPYIQLSLGYDNRVVIIKVEPFPYGLVRLKEKSYIRANAESIVMTPAMEARLLSEKRSRNTEREEKIIRLMEGKTKRLKVCLCDYGSNNSGTFSNYLVEAYEIFPDEGVIAALDENGLKVKVFKIDRIGHVEITETSWNHIGLHQIVKTDPFHMTGTKPIHCCLRLNMRAHNLLVEEFPATRSMLKQDKSMNDPHWIFDVDVYSMAGIGRFYLGLALDIEIISAPELAAYAKQFIGQIVLP